jgi:hypothetical protein
MPSTPAPPLAARRQSRQIMVGSVPVGGGAPVSVQSMTTTVTADVNATLQQIAELTASGCQIVRVAVPSQDDVEAPAGNAAARTAGHGRFRQTPWTRTATFAVDALNPRWPGAVSVLTVQPSTALTTDSGRVQQGGNYT